MLPGFKPQFRSLYGRVALPQQAKERELLPASNPAYLSYSGAIDHLLKELLQFTAYTENLGWSLKQAK